MGKQVGYCKLGTSNQKEKTHLFFLSQYQNNGGSGTTTESKFSIVSMKGDLTKTVDLRLQDYLTL